MAWNRFPIGINFIVTPTHAANYGYILRNDYALLQATAPIGVALWPVANTVPKSTVPKIKPRHP